jgi:hypothetical protein
VIPRYMIHKSTEESNVSNTYITSSPEHCCYRPEHQYLSFRLRTRTVVHLRHLFFPREQSRVCRAPRQKADFGRCGVSLFRLRGTLLRLQGLQSLGCWNSTLSLAAKEGARRIKTAVWKSALFRRRDMTTRRLGVTRKDSLVIRRWHVLLRARWCNATVDAVFSDEGKARPSETVAKEVESTRHSHSNHNKATKNATRNRCNGWRRSINDGC